MKNPRGEGITVNQQSANDSPVLCALCVSVANPAFCQRSLRLCALCVSVANPSFCQRSLRLCALCVSVANPAFSSVRLAAIAYHCVHVLCPRGVPCSWLRPQA